MPVTLASHYTLRNIPWDVLFTKCFSPWQIYIKEQRPWNLLERTSRFFNSDGLQDQLQYEFSENFIHHLLQEERPEEYPLDFLGFDHSLSYRDGSTIKVRFTATRVDEGNIVADLYTTLDLASGRKMQGAYLSLHHKLRDFSINSPDTAYAPKLYFGKEPQSIFLQTSRSTLWKHIANRGIDLRIDTQEFLESITKDSSSLENSIGDTSKPEHSPMENSVNEYSATKYSAKKCLTEECSNPECLPAKQSTGEYPPEQYSKLQERIRQLEESLEETVNENNALTEQLEDSQHTVRKLQNDKIIQNRAISELKDKNERIKKRMKQADKRANMSADEKFSKFCEDFDKENEELQLACRSAKVECEELKQKLRDAEGKVVSLKGRLAKVSYGLAGGLLNAPNESEKFENEYGIAIFSALHKAIEKTPSKSNSYGNRPIDAWKAIIQANPDMERAYQNYKDTKNQLMDAMKSNELERNFHLLAPLGMDYSTHTNNHWKLHFIDGDRRYNATHASTPSETASGPSNSAKDLKNAFLYPT